MAGEAFPGRMDPGARMEVAPEIRRGTDRPSMVVVKETEEVRLTAPTDNVAPVEMTAHLPDRVKRVGHRSIGPREKPVLRDLETATNIHRLRQSRGERTDPGRPASASSRLGMGVE